MYLNFNGETVLSGNIGKEVTVAHTPSGTAVAEFSLAVNRWDNLEKKQRTTWYPCKAFGKIANDIEKNLKKGSRTFLKVRYETEPNNKHHFLVLEFEQIKKENVVVQL